MDNNNISLKFPKGFLWGVGSSAYQFEGESINTQWYEFEKTDGIKTGDFSGKACDWWKNADRGSYCEHSDNDPYCAELPPPQLDTLAVSLLQFSHNPLK